MVSVWYVVVTKNKDDSKYSKRIENTLPVHISFFPSSFLCQRLYAEYGKSIITRVSFLI